MAKKKKRTKLASDPDEKMPPEIGPDPERQAPEEPEEQDDDEDADEDDDPDDENLDDIEDKDLDEEVDEGGVVPRKESR